MARGAEPCCRALVTPTLRSTEPPIKSPALNPLLLNLRTALLLSRTHLPTRKFVDAAMDRNEGGDTARSGAIQSLLASPRAGGSPIAGRSPRTVLRDKVSAGPYAAENASLEKEKFLLLQAVARDRRRAAELTKRIEQTKAVSTILQMVPWIACS